MKRLYFPSLLLLFSLLLFSCASGPYGEEDIVLLLSVKPTREETFASTELAYERYGDDERVLYNYAYMLLDYDRYEDCIRVCDEALALNPTSLRFSYLKASAAYESGHHQTYLSTLENILSFDEGNQSVLELLAQYHENFFHHSIAVGYARRLLDLNPSNTVAIKILAVDSPYFASLAGESTEETVQSRDELRRPSLPPFDIRAALELFISEH